MLPGIHRSSVESVQMVFDQLAISFFSSQRHRPLYCSVISSSSLSPSHNDEPFAGESSSGVLLGLLLLYVRLYMLHSCLPLRRALYFPRVADSPTPQASSPSAASDSSQGAYSSTSREEGPFFCEAQDILTTSIAIFSPSHGVPLTNLPTSLWQ